MLDEHFTNLYAPRILANQVGNTIFKKHGNNFYLYVTFGHSSESYAILIMQLTFVLFMLYDGKVLL